MRKIFNLQRLLIFNLLSHPLFAGSFVMIIGSNLINFLNYIYHLIMGRMLGPSSYGELAVLLSLLGFLGMIPFSLGLVIVKFISSAKTFSGVKKLATWFSKKSFSFSLAILAVTILSSKFLASFLNIKNEILIIVVSVTFFFSLPALFNRVILQGVFKFKHLVASLLVETSIKLILAAVLVYFGLGVLGAVLALVTASSVGWILSKHFIREYLNKITSTPKLGPMFLYSLPVLIQSLSLTSLYSADLILVKHFFPSHEAGIYAALSTLGRIIFFGAGPIGAVMFPMVSQRQARRQSYRQVFIYSLILTLFLSGGVLLFYWLFPKLAINILYGPLYLEASNLLVWFGIFMTLFTLSSLLISFYLSLGKTAVVVLPLLSAILQVIGIWLFHDSLGTVIMISIITSFFLLLSLLFYLGFTIKKVRGDE